MTQTVGWNRWLWLTLFVALGLRLGLALAVQFEVSKIPGRLCLITGDAEGYWELAGQLAAGKPYSIYDPPRRLLRMPGFPLLLALPRVVLGDNPFAARILLALIGTLACALTYWLGSELAGKTVGVIAAAYTAISPTMSLFSVLFLSETAFAAALLGSLIAAAKLIRIQPSTDGTRQQSVWLAMFTGGLVGLATYLRPTWLLVGPGLGLLVIVCGQQSVRQRLILASMICFGLGIVMLPWTIRNTLITGHPIPTTLWVGPSLYDGLNPHSTGDSDMEFFEQDRLMQTMSEYDMDQEYRRRAWSYAAAHPSQVLRLAAMKQVRFWSPAPNASQFDNPLIHLAAWLAFLPLITLAMAGAWFARRDWPLVILTVAPLLYFAALHLLFVGSLRYRLPAEYPLAVLAAVGLLKLTHRELGKSTANR
jgi:4-amino-4-deoxy-L-arabinose transferase-like glycosyltransferase